MEKSKISAEIVADSKNEHGQRITTFVLTFPRHILAELNTHRMFSRNSASSRAIPFEKMVEKCKNDPFIPVAWQKDHSGMQGTEYYEEGSDDYYRAIGAWAVGNGEAINAAERLSLQGVTKQLCNRLLEPFMWHTAIVTATEFENFFKQRSPQYGLFSENHKLTFRSKRDFNSYVESVGDDEYQLTDIEWLKINEGGAEIHIMELAEQMWDALNENNPKQLEEGEWHIPFGDKFDGAKLEEYFGDGFMADTESMNSLKIKIATARCARISYMNYDGTDDYEKDIKLHDRLSKMRHWSPFEHVARAMTWEEYSTSANGRFSFKEQDNSIHLISPQGEDVRGWSGNFKGFIQYRKTFKGESGEK